MSGLPCGKEKGKEKGGSGKRPLSVTPKLNCWSRLWLSPRPNAARYLMRKRRINIYTCEILALTESLRALPGSSKYIGPTLPLHTFKHYLIGKRKHKN